MAGMKPIKIKHPGGLTAKAKAHGMSINEFAQRHQHDPGSAGEESRLYLNVFKPANRARKSR